MFIAMDMWNAPNQQAQNSKQHRRFIMHVMRIMFVMPFEPSTDAFTPRIRLLALNRVHTALPKTPYLVASSKLQGSSLLQHLSSLPKSLTVRVIYEDIDVDFLPAQAFAASFWPEHLIIDANAEDLKARLKVLGKNSKSVLIVEKTQLTSPKFAEIQWMATFEFNISTLPVASPAEAMRYIARIEHKPQKPTTSTSAPSNKTKNAHQSLVQTVKACPGVGEVKAIALLREFKTLQSLANASEAELLKRVPIVGKPGARKL
ncbi:hypothetical protein HK104_001422, partial [Borealophlyctis nickersoniae]